MCPSSIKPLAALDPYDGIAWDFDNTLVDNPNASLFYQYIQENPEKRHQIVTFRTHGMQDRMFPRLQETEGAPTENDFRGYFNVPDDLWFNWNMDQIKRERGIITGRPTEAETLYGLWKGYICRKHGLSVLIDDDLISTVPGCKKYKIKLMSSYTLEFVV